MNVQSFHQLPPLTLPIRLAFLPVGLDLTDSRGQLRVLLSLQLQLLLESVQLGVVVAQRSADQVFLFR